MLKTNFCKLKWNKRHQTHLTFTLLQNTPPACWSPSGNTPNLLPHKLYLILLFLALRVLVDKTVAQEFAFSKILNKHFIHHCNTITVVLRLRSLSVLDSRFHSLQPSFAQLLGPKSLSESVFSDISEWMSNNLTPGRLKSRWSCVHLWSYPSRWHEKLRLHQSGTQLQTPRRDFW